MTDVTPDDPRPARPAPGVERGGQPETSPPDSLPPGGLPAGTQGDEADPGTGRIFEGLGEDPGAIGPGAGGEDELDARVLAGA